MDLAAIWALEILFSIATLIVISVGLAVIFGMMRVINIAHGEFLMLGGYAAVISNRQLGVDIWVSMLLIAPLAVAVVGVAVERLVIRHLYGRNVDSLLATWGLSLFLIGTVTVLFGNTIEGVSAPLGALQIGAYSFSLYNVFIILMAGLMLAAIFAVLKFTKLGLIARGTMQNPDMAGSLGVSPNTVYMVTFAVGAALSGLAGGLLAPLTGVVPTMGAAYIAEAFITVIGGGAAMVAGTLSAATLFGGVSKTVTFLSSTVYGDIALLLGALVLLRLLPRGITGRFFRRSL
jgi:branched-chain amino acid transport system permease protein